MYVRLSDCLSVCLGNFYQCSSVYLFSCQVIGVAMYPSLCLSVCLFICLSVCLSDCEHDLFVCLFVCLSICLCFLFCIFCPSICRSVCRSVCLFIFLSVYLTVISFIYLYVCLFICLSVWSYTFLSFLPIHFISFCRSVYPLISLSATALCSYLSIFLRI